jgi:hypothetical protein
MLLYRSGAGYDPRICHTLTVPSDAADARASPCGLNHTPATKPVWPVSEATFRPVELDKSSMSAWFVTIATRSPVSWNRQFTALSMCASGCPSFNRCNVAPSPALFAMNVVPSGEKSTDVNES